MKKTTNLDCSWELNGLISLVCNGTQTKLMDNKELREIENFPSDCPENRDYENSKKPHFFVFPSFP